jgi:MarR family transcriptional regulator, organic hydroperoxide resistance regulator
MPEFLDLHGRTSKALRALAEADMRRFGLYLGQDLVLAVLWERDGRTPGEVAGVLHVTTPTIVKMATRMAAAGLLTRRRDDTDNRLVRLWLTEAGSSLKQPVETARQSLEDKVTADLTDPERQCLLNALAKIHRTAGDMLSGSADHGATAARLQVFWRQWLAAAELNSLRHELHVKASRSSAARMSLPLRPRRFVSCPFRVCRMLRAPAMCDRFTLNA